MIAGKTIFWRVNAVNIVIQEIIVFADLHTEEENENLSEKINGILEEDKKEQEDSPIRELVSYNMHQDSFQKQDFSVEIRAKDDGNI